jgi:hypothetical protein
MNPAPSALPAGHSSSSITSSEIITRSSSFSAADFRSPSYPQYGRSPSVGSRSPNASRVSSEPSKPSPLVNSKRRTSRPQTPRLSSSTSSPAAPKPSNPSIKSPAPPSTPNAPASAPQAAGTSSPPKRPRHLDPSVQTLPLLYQHCPIQDLVYLISDMLLELVGLNDKIPLSGAGLTRFHSRYSLPCKHSPQFTR